MDYIDDLADMMVRNRAIQFGDFTLKSGKKSRFFINLAAVNNGPDLIMLASAYAQVIYDRYTKEDIEVLFGPAYKGIPLCSAVAMILAQKYQWSLPFAYDRKEAKDHGEGGRIVAPFALKGKKVLIIDDVLTAGTACLASIQMLQQLQAKVVGCIVAIDRQEVLDNQASAATRITQAGCSVEALATLEQLMTSIRRREDGQEMTENFDE